MGPQLYRCGNRDRDTSHATQRMLLQWGRNFIVAETGIGIRRTPRRGCCFNGAATLSLRKPSPQWPGVSLIARASMGPQLYRCGNQNALMILFRLRIASMGPQLYRCGNIHPPEPAVDRGRASMGPQLYRCGNTDPASPAPDMRRASMGPQLYRCGNKQVA